jgi:hypothetical protein
MRKIILPIEGTAITCQRSAVPTGAGANGNTHYPEGVCPHFRQYPNGNSPVCLIFQKDVRTGRGLKNIEPGLTVRLPECCAAEKDAGRAGFIQILIVANELVCELKPMLKAKERRDDPWIDETSGHETLYYPDQVCGFYVDFPNGSSWCRIHHQQFSRNAEGFTRRLPACIRAEDEQKK